MITNQTVKVKTEPTERAISVAQARRWVKASTSEDDSSIDGFIDLATAELEAFTDRKFLSQTLEWFFDGLPCVSFLELPIGDDVSEITSVKYYTTADVLTPYADSKYTLDSETIPNKILLNDGNVWPTDVRETKSWVVEFKAGVSTPELVHPRIRTALLKMVASQMDSGRTNDRIDLDLFQSALLEVADLKTHW